MPRNARPSIVPRPRGLADTLEVEETVDTLFDGRLAITQHVEGYRFSVDALLLAAAADESRGARVVDLGTGCGVIALALAHWYRPAHVLAVELQPQLLRLAVRNVELNQANDVVQVVAGDVRDLRRAVEPLEPQTYAVAVCNPPYYPVGSGRLNPNWERAVARHELEGTLSDFVSAAGYALTPRGVLYTVYPAERLPLLLAALEGHDLRPEWLQLVHPRLGEPATLVLGAARRQGARPLVVRPPLAIHAGSGYTPEVTELLAGRPPCLPGQPSWEPGA